MWAFDLARAFFPFMSPELVARAERSAVEIQRYMDDLLAQRRAEPQDDLVSMLVTDEVDQALSPDEIRALACNMIFAGLEATAKGVATGIYHLLAHGQFARLAARARAGRDRPCSRCCASRRPPSTSPDSPPTDMVCQDVAAPRRPGGERQHRRRLPRPAALRQPDELDVARLAGKQLYFGAGAHYCLGASLAKLGLGIAFETLARRFPGFVAGRTTATPSGTTRASPASSTSTASPEPERRLGTNVNHLVDIVSVSM